MNYLRLLGAWTVVSLGLGTGCGLVLGLNDFQDAPSRATSGAGGETSNGNTGGGASEGAGGSFCAPADTMPCYEGPAASENVGACKPGLRTCDAQTRTYGDCVNQVLPHPEDCSKAGDEDCDGTPCSDVIWAKAFPYTQALTDDKFLMATDPQGNVYLSGRLSATVDFGGEPLVPVNRDVFIAKLDKNGNHVWSHRFGQSGTDGADALAVDAQGNLTIAGVFRGTINFGQGTLTSSGQGSIFIATFDADGAPLHSKSWGGNPSTYTHVFDVAVDSVGNVILAGAYAGTLNFGGSITVASAGGSDTQSWDSFLVKLTPSLDGIWGKSYNDINNEWARISLKLDSSDSILMGGDFRGQMSIGSTTLSAVQRAPFLAKLASSGVTLWALEFGTPNTSSNLCLTGLAVDKQGNAFISGFFDGSMRFSDDSVLTGPGGYIVEFNANSTKGYSTIHANANEGRLAADAFGNIISAGSLRGPTDFGGGPATPTGHYYLVKRKPDGEYLWEKRFAMIGAQDVFPALSAEPASNTIYLAGRIEEGTLDFGKGPIGPGLYVARFNP